MPKLNKSDIAVSIETEGTRLSVSGSVKLSRKMVEQDVFVTVEGGASLSMDAEKNLIEQRKRMSRFVRASITAQLDAQLRDIQKRLAT